MDKNVEQLLLAEKQVNEKVAEAQKQRKEKMDSIDREVKIALKDMTAEFDLVKANLDMLQ